MWNYSGGQQEPLQDLEQGSHTMKAGFQDQWTRREETDWKTDICLKAAAAIQSLPSTIV